MKTEIIIFEHDIQKYPPILSIINYLLNNKRKVVIISCCRSQELIDYIEKKGGSFFNIIDNNVRANSIEKFFRLLLFKRKTLNIVKSFSNINDTVVWLFGETAIWLFPKVFSEFRCIAYLFETPNFEVYPRYKMISPSLNYKKVLGQAAKVVCCEYNRAYITKSFFGLDQDPIVIPNKPYHPNLGDHIEIELGEQLTGKKIILYQGIFNYPERKMDSLCDAISKLPDEFVLCLMGGDSPYKSQLKEKYKESKRIFFLPYVQAPKHLSFTKKAYIGFISYTAESDNIRNTLNTLYCAPNKIYEYSQFSIPMVSNRLPALTMLFDKFESGIAVESTKESLAEAIMTLDANYERYAIGARKMYEDVDLEKLYSGLLL